MTKILFLITGAVIFSLLLAACGAGTPATPTQSPDAIYTEVASTIQAAVTQTAASTKPGKYKFNKSINHRSSNNRPTSANLPWLSDRRPCDTRVPSTG
jgi:hypothetical protein